MKYNIFLVIENDNFAKVIAEKRGERIEFWFNNPDTSLRNVHLAKMFKKDVEEMMPGRAAQLLDYEKESFVGLVELRNCRYIKDKTEFEQEEQDKIDAAIDDFLNEPEEA